MNAILMRYSFFIKYFTDNAIFRKKNIKFQKNVKIQLTKQRLLGIMKCANTKINKNEDRRQK
jgi:hypothetical protein